MSESHKSPDDFQADANFNLPQDRLDEIERQLKRVRLRAPHLDLAAIERLAREGPPPKQTSSTADESGFVVRRPAFPLGATGRYRSYSALAGSWICGAAAGAIVMFLIVGRSTPQAAPSRQTGQLAQEPGRVTTPDAAAPPDAASQHNEAVGVTPAIEKSTPRIDSYSPATAAILDLDAGDSPGYGRHNPTLRAGSFLRPLTGLVREENKEKDVLSMSQPSVLPSVLQSDSVTLPRADDDSTPTPPVTRETLLRELLRSDADFTL